MDLVPYIFFNGQCREALEFYEQTLGGKINYIATYADTPPDQYAQVTPDARNRIMHARITIGSSVVMASDAPAAHFEKPQGFSLSIQPSDPAEADRLFAALAEGGQVRMPIQQTFWAKRFGMLVDRFGIPWFINCQ